MIYTCVFSVEMKKRQRPAYDSTRCRLRFLCRCYRAGFLFRGPWWANHLPFSRHISKTSPIIPFFPCGKRHLVKQYNGHANDLFFKRKGLRLLIRGEGFTATTPDFSRTCQHVAPMGHLPPGVRHGKRPGKHSIRACTTTFQACSR